MCGLDATERGEAIHLAGPSIQRCAELGGRSSPSVPEVVQLRKSPKEPKVYLCPAKLCRGEHCGIEGEIHQKLAMVLQLFVQQVKSER